MKMLYAMGGTVPRSGPGWQALGAHGGAAFECPQPSSQHPFYAATRCLEIMSEAARRLTPAMRDRRPDLPWRAIMGPGNIYRDEYDDVVESFVWRTIHEGLGPRLAMVEQELGQL
jgi:uncharacterized protein with HEPN domain